VPLTVEALRKFLEESDVNWHAPDETPGVTQTLWQCEHFRDEDGSSVLAVFLLIDESGELLTLQTQPLLDLARVRFVGPLAATVLELGSTRVASRFVREPEGTQLALRIDLPLLDGALGREQLLFLLEELVSAADSLYPTLRAAADGGRTGDAAHDPEPAGDGG
jgi:hypothetical protein